MPGKGALPDAWDDDWESLADKQETSDMNEEPPAPVKISKAERKAKHAELNRQIWESAEKPEPMLFLEARDNIPLKTTFKPSVTVLSRKPPPQLLSRNDASAGMAGLTLEDDEDSEEERRKKNEASFAERQARAQKERAEKERRYAEAREKLFGSSTLNAEDSRGRSSPNKHTRGKGRGRGGRDSQPRSSNEQSPAGTGNPGRQLYDPSYSPKPNSVYIQKKEFSGSRPETPSDLQQPIREPRGPGRGGKGFAPRGNRTGSAV
ncbi:uncharacterized protein BDR25DRAFT_18309 [Lindgomyces ingoldianus]|uniref:Uncharacterized protein n=1 Tax=Lindgomyces ingoldianus TaxID=673940 RepID=A0ACB6R191_9PLEO|nr:uncharacterized protein BDR25DRAFT_18309 [Lindgomyces ingoldianus]KAF2472100.1 hypothetical protein BDR25DRAFT_18309 [Lindgomyces ingoldianus]